MGPGARLRSLLSSREELYRQELCAAAKEHDATPEVGCQVGSQVKLFGTLVSVTMAPASPTPVLTAEFSDGTRRVQLRWLGRRSIPGVEPGRRITVHGRLARLDSGLGLFNPAYELAPLSVST